VLIVDDSATIRLVIRTLFEAQNFDVHEAATGLEGVQEAQKLHPSLIILDVSMPIMNGLEAARELKQLMPQVPLLMFTNHDGAIVEQEARSVGFSAVVRKSDADASQQLLAGAKTLLGLDGTGVGRAS
jgi:CheY-like chemotaxis protein